MSAFNNKVPPNYTETSRWNSSNVAPAVCHNQDQARWPKNGHGAGCFWRGPAFDTGSDPKHSPNELHEMLDWRIDHQPPSAWTDNGQAMYIWNEVILDGQLMDKALAADPAGTVPAFVYSTEKGMGPLGTVKRMNAAFTKKHMLKKPLPIMRLDTQSDARSDPNKPWSFHPEDQLDDLLLV